MTTAFQSNAFQNNAFQIDSGTTQTFTGARTRRGTGWARKTLTELREEAEAQARADAAKAARKAAKAKADKEADAYFNAIDGMLAAYTRKHADEVQRLAAYEAELERQRAAHIKRIQSDDEDAILFILLMA